MIKLKSLFLLLEDRVSDFQKRYTNIPLLIQSYIIKNDPDKNHKYLDWIGKILLKEPEIDAVVLMDLIKIFDSKFKNIDIHSIKSFQQLSDLIKNRKISKREKIVGEAEILWDDEDFLVVAPQSHEASRYFGGSTNWCLSTSNTDAWEDYYYHNTIIMIKSRKLSENDNYYKICLVGNGVNPLRMEWYDKYDSTMGGEQRKEIWNRFPSDLQEKIEYYIDSDNVEERHYEFEDIKMNKWWEMEGYHSMMATLASLFKKHYNIEGHLDVDFVDKMEAFIEISVGGKENAQHIMYRVMHNSVMESGINNIGYVRDYAKFLDYADDDKEENDLSLTDVMDNFFYDLKSLDKYFNIIVDSIGEGNFNILFSDYDLEKNFLDSLTKYKKMLNDQRQLKLFPFGLNPPGSYDVNPVPEQHPVIASINDIIYMLKKTGYDPIATFIEVNMNKNIHENFKSNFMFI